MHEYYRIQEHIWPHLEQAGFTIESDDHQIDYCGSMRTIYVKGDRRVLLKWDGEEGLGYAEVWRNNEWRLLPTKVLESKESEFQAAIQRLCVDLHRYIN